MNKPEDPKKEPSYGQIMTGLLIPKGSYSNPKRILSGIAFISLVAFFLFAALHRSCQKETPQEKTVSQYHIHFDSRNG
ncbi:MAG: hypothetical protein JEY79_12565 [Pseudodesulfovibrio sp.]|nr:hypothetical protein [Pseudodesulfovibrio sp.]